MIEYLMDCVELDPAEEFPTLVQEAGTYARKTGDPLFDRWQEAAARGDRIDFDEAFGDPEALRAFAAAKAASRARHEAKRGARPAAEPEDVHDDYTKEG